MMSVLGDRLLVGIKENLKFVEKTKLFDSCFFFQWMFEFIFRNFNEIGTFFNWRGKWNYLVFFSLFFFLFLKNI